MSDTFKEGKRGRPRPKLRPLSVQHGEVVLKRHQHGSTEKILRRNRKTWTRLANKICRRIDKETIREEMIS